MKVYRVVYQWQAREPAEPEVGFDGGDIIEGEWNAPTTRYFWSPKTLARKIKSIRHPNDDAPGQIISVSWADVGPWARMKYDDE